MVHLGTINDTRLQAGSFSTSGSAFPSEATTAEPSVVTIGDKNINQTSTLYPTPTDNTVVVIYTSILMKIIILERCQLTDMKDTFLHPAFDSLFSSLTLNQQAGTYFVITCKYKCYRFNRGKWFKTPVFVDTTRANTSAYTAGSIPETLDQPTNIDKLLFT